MSRRCDTATTADWAPPLTCGCAQARVGSDAKPMDIVSLLLSAEVIACIAFLGGTVVAVRAVLAYARGSGELAEMLDRLDSTLTKLRDQLPAKQERVSTYEKSLPPLKQQYQRLLDYYNKLRDLELEEEKAEIEAEEEAQAERRRGRFRPPGN